MKHVLQPAKTVADRDSTPNSFLADFKAALLNRRHQSTPLERVRPTLSAHLRYLAALLRVRAVLVAVATWAMLRLEVFDRPGTAVSIYLLIVSLISLMDGVATSAVFS